MAEMFPPECREDTRSKAERRYFDRLRVETGGDWFVLHSVGLTGHRRKPWAEIDFVLIGPPGIFCLEVKGGRVSRSQGRWYFTDGNGNVNVKDEGPFEQVATAAAEMRKQLTEKAPELRYAPVGWGVVTPDIVFTATGPDIEARVLFDERDRGRPVSAYLRRLADFWHEEIERITGHPVIGLTDRQRRAALEAIRADFDLRPSLRTRAGVIADEMLQLTTEQYRILDGLRDNARAVIRGCAGSGKTLLALEEVRRRANAGERVLLCCRTPQLAAHLAGSTADLPGVECCDLRTFMAETVAAAGLAARLPPAEEADLFAIFLPELCIEALLELNRAQTYDLLVIDEAQDLLSPEFLAFFDALLAGGIITGKWMMFLDAYQDVFETISPGGWDRLLAAKPAQFRLTVNCRNTKPIAVATQILSGVEWEETLHVSGPDVEQHFCAAANDVRRETSRCIRRWLSDGIQPAQIVVLSPRPLADSAVADGLLDVPCNFTSDRQPALNTIAFREISDFKGLECDFVAILDVDDLETPAALISLYVACSRARVGLAIFLYDSVSETYRKHAGDYGVLVANNRKQAQRAYSAGPFPRS
jgi:hypothetical protein